jgi:hypothetical protein
VNSILKKCEFKFEKQWVQSLRVIWRTKIFKCFQIEIFIYFESVQKRKARHFYGAKGLYEYSHFSYCFPQILKKSCIFGLFNSYIKLVSINFFFDK